MEATLSSMKKCHVMTVCVSAPTSTVSIVTLIYSAVTLLTAIVTVVDSRPTSETVTVGVPLDSDNDSRAAPGCIDLCQKCFNSSGTHQGADNVSNELPELTILPQQGNSRTNILKGNQRNEETEKLAEEVPVHVKQRTEEGYLRFSPEGHKRRQEVTTPPCMRQFMGHVTSLEQELLKLDTRVQSMMGRLGLSSADHAASGNGRLQET